MEKHHKNRTKVALVGDALVLGRFVGRATVTLGALIMASVWVAMTTLPHRHVHTRNGRARLSHHAAVPTEESKHNHACVRAPSVARYPDSARTLLSLSDMRTETLRVSHGMTDSIITRRSESVVYSATSS